MAQRKTTNSSKNGNSGRSTRSAKAGGTTRSGGSRGGSRKGGQSGGMMNLLKAFLFVLGIAVIFGLASWGLEKLGERGEKKNKTNETTSESVTPTGKGKAGNQDDPTLPTDTPTPVLTQTLEKRAEEVLRGVAKSKLKLDKNLSEYRLEIDDYTSNFPGRDKEYVGVNVLQKDSGMLVAIYYVAVDGTEILREREDGEFDTIKP